MPALRASICAHAPDFHALIGVHVGRERKDLRFLSRAGGGEKFFHHRQGPLVMLDHQLEEEPIELGPSGWPAAASLPGMQHAPHQRLP